MVDYSDIRCTSPSIAFFFARLGAFLGSLSGHCPWVGGFVLGDSGLKLALVSLYPLLHQSLDWFRSMREVLRRERMGLEIRSSDLETGPSSKAGTVGLTQTSLLLYPHLPTFLFRPHPNHFTPSKRSFP